MCQLCTAPLGKCAKPRHAVVALALCVPESCVPTGVVLTLRKVWRADKLHEGTCVVVVRTSLYAKSHCIGACLGWIVPEHVHQHQLGLHAIASQV